MNGLGPDHRLTLRAGMLAAESPRQAVCDLGPAYHERECDDNNQRKLIEFLQSLVLFPPDDTASNLHPGVSGSDNPQDPANHGSINLSVLFQDARDFSVSCCISLPSSSARRPGNGPRRARPAVMRE